MQHSPSLSVVLLLPQCWQAEGDEKESEKKASGAEQDMVIEEGGVSRTPHSLSSIRT